MAGSISLALSQQFDPSGKPYGGGLVFFIQAGTVATPQNAFQDLGLTTPWPNPYTLLADGRVPQVYFADGYIKVRITDLHGVQIFNQDNIPVTGPSSGGGGGGGGVDPTSVIQTGQLIHMYGTGVLTGFVRANASTIGNSVSGAVERANADTAALFSFLWNADPHLAVGGGRGVSASADYSAGKVLALPDLRGRAIVGLDDMGNSAAGRLTSTYFGAATGANGTTLGGAGGSESVTLTLAQIPTGIVSSGTFNLSISNVVTAPVGFANFSANPGSQIWAATSAGNFVANNGVTASGTTTSTNTGNAAHKIMSPAMLATIYLKL